MHIRHIRIRIFQYSNNNDIMTVSMNVKNVFDDIL